METRTDSRIGGPEYVLQYLGVSGLVKAAMRLRRLKSLMTTASVAGVILASILGSVGLWPVTGASIVLGLVSAVVAAIGYGKIYQEERKYESTLGDYLVKNVNEGLERIPVSHRRLALEVLFTIAEASAETTRHRVLDLSRMASTVGISREEATELLNHLEQSGFITVQRTANEESVNLSHSLLADLLLERRQKIVLDLLAQASRNEPPNARHEEGS